LTSRDFTFIENAVQKNIKALLFGSVNSSGVEKLTKHEMLNMACGDQVTLNEIVAMLNQISGQNIQPIYGPERKGDVKHSKASIEKISKVIIYEPQFRFQKGLEIVFEWYKMQKDNDIRTSNNTAT
jgi:UDP-N-acetylglucosamine 4-epimerase